jgi:hypothetical protein
MSNRINRKTATPEEIAAVVEYKNSNHLWVSMIA